MNYDDVLIKELEGPVSRRKYSKILGFLLVSALLQLSVLYGAEHLLSGKKTIDVEPTKTLAVNNRSLKLNPPPSEPTRLTISPDRSRLALVNEDSLRIYNLTDGQLVLTTGIEEGTYPAALQWLPDRNRLIYTLVNPHKSKSTTVTEKIPVATGVKDETYSTDVYRTETKVLTKEGFELQIYSLEGDAGAEPELIKAMLQEGTAPKEVNMEFSTYTNLLFLNWQQNDREYLTQVDIMKRVKDLRLPSGRLNRLLVTPRDGQLWAEFSTKTDTIIYKYVKGRWKAPEELNGYRLIGVSPDDRLAVAPDQGGLVGQVFLTDLKGDFKPGWAFSYPIKLANVQVLKDGRLMYLQSNRVIVHTPQLGKGTVYDTGRVDAYSADGKMVAAWQDNTLNIFEEVTETKK